MQRLDKVLVNLGKGSRSEIKNLAKASKIHVNGVVCKKSDTKIDPEKDEIIFCGEKISYVTDIYIMLNKKGGFVTANCDHCDPTVFDLLPREYSKMNLFAVGRLDKDTEGLLIITNDGELSHRLTSPKHHAEKTYYAKVDGEILESHIEIFKNGIVFKDGTALKPAVLEIINKNEAYVTITEGKFHQVKNMFRVIDCTVTYLKRSSMGGIKLDENLDLGSFRDLTEEEVSILKENAYGK